jgi:hypothetical protein
MKHGDTGTCRDCLKPVQFYDANANVIQGTGHWFHTGRTYPEGSRQAPIYCDETKAEI